MIFLDYDECDSGDHGCDTNALCTNTIGSYACDCVDGYTGNIHGCDGKLTQ